MIGSAIPCFPPPYEDELFYGTCARFTQIAAYRSKRMVVEQLFGTSNALAVMDLPSRLEYFVDHLLPGYLYSVDRIIDEQTLLPFYEPFLPRKRAIALRKDMRVGAGMGIHMRAGIMASRIRQPAYFRLCPHCVEVDRSHHGECYWHRVHQLPGVMLCPAHCCLLVETSVQTHNAKTRYEFVAAEDAALRGMLELPTKLPDSSWGQLNAVARDALWLLQHPDTAQEQWVIGQRYLRLLAERGLATNSGRIRVRELQRSFVEYFTADLLKLLACDPDDAVENWLLRLLRNTAALSPLYHLLLIHFLGHSVESFWEIQEEWHAFGEGPWPCMNPVCEKYLVSHIREHTIHFTSGNPVAVFTCDICGYSYSRVGPDTSPNDLHRASRVESYGDIWQRRLGELWSNPNMSLREIARIFCVDPQTIKHHVRRLGLPLRSAKESIGNQRGAIDSATELTRNAETQLESHRKLWLDAVKNEPNAGCAALRSKHGAVYSWLYRNDRTWLVANTPRRMPSLQKVPRVDWSLRDSLLAKEVKQSYDRILASELRPTRASKTAIANGTSGRAMIQQHLDRLPETSDALNDLAETRESFALRRIRWVNGIFHEQGLKPSRWKLIKPGFRTLKIK
jgi:hypothetical protein